MVQLHLYRTVFLFPSRKSGVLPILGMVPFRPRKECGCVFSAGTSISNHTVKEGVGRLVLPVVLTKCTKGLGMYFPLRAGLREEMGRVALED